MGAPGDQRVNANQKIEIRAWLAWLIAAVALIAALVNPVFLVRVLAQGSVVESKLDAVHQEVTRLRDSEILQLRQRVNALSEQVSVLKDRANIR